MRKKEKLSLRRKKHKSLIMYKTLNELSPDLLSMFNVFSLNVTLMIKLKKSWWKAFAAKAKY